MQTIVPNRVQDLLNGPCRCNLLHHFVANFAGYAADHLFYDYGLPMQHSKQSDFHFLFPWSTAIVFLFPSWKIQIKLKKLKSSRQNKLFLYLVFTWKNHCESLSQLLFLQSKNPEYPTRIISKISNTINIFHWFT